jgi:hypothetical protein
MEFWFVRFVPKYMKCSTFTKDLLHIFMLRVFLHAGPET